MSALDVLRDQLREQSPPPTVNEIQERLERLRVQLADLIETQAQLLIEQWRSENPGQEPEEIRPGEAVHQWIHENLWVEASRDSDWLAEELWARNSPAWVVRAASLIEARTIDGLPLPQHRDDPITREVAAAVEEDLSLIHI